MQLTRAILPILLPLDFAGMAADTSGNPCVWLNRYQCQCGASWSDSWSCQCDDECGNCHRDISPHASEWVGSPSPIAKQLWELLPEAGDGDLMVVRPGAGRTFARLQLGGTGQPKRSKLHSAMKAAVIARCRSDKIDTVIAGVNPEISDSVLIRTSGGDTIYLYPEDAHALGYFLIKAANNPNNA